MKRDVEPERHRVSSVDIIFVFARNPGILGLLSD